MSDRLLDPEFLGKLEALRRRFAPQVRSGSAGEGIAARRGASSEFREHRAYVAGDDVRRVDWLAFARTGEPVLKLFEAEEDSVVRLLVDASASLAFGNPSKFEVLQRTAAALAYLTLTSGSRVQVAASQFDDAVELGRLFPPQRGRRAFSDCCRKLEGLKAEGRTDLARALDRLLQHSRVPGVLVVLSDFFDAGPVLPALRRARAERHEILLVQILTPDELEPALEGDYCLVDAETGAELSVTLDVAALESYGKQLAALQERLSAWSRQHGATYVRLQTTDALEEAIRRILARDDSSAAPR